MQLLCPQCDTSIRSEDMNVEQAIAKCRRCHEVFGFADQLENTVVPGRMQPAGRGEVPIPDRIRVETWGGELVIRRRWFSHSLWFALLFVIAWDSFLVVWYAIAIFGLGAAGGAGGEGWFMIIFPIAHVGVGVGLTYFVLSGFLNTTTVRIGNGTLSVRHGPIPARGNRSLQTADIAQLFCAEHSGGMFQSHHRPDGTSSIDLKALLRDQTQVTLIASLPEVNQALYLEQQIERHLGIADAPVGGELPR